MITLKLDDNEVSDLENYLRIAREEYEGHAKNMRDVAAELRAGKTIGMFAPGEDGARAADRLAEQFDAQIRDVATLVEKLDAAVEEDDYSDDEREQARIEDEIARNGR